jgi:hypothetical protein
MLMRGVTFGALVIASVCGVVSAQQESAGPAGETEAAAAKIPAPGTTSLEGPPERWSLRVEAGAWFVGLAGDATFSRTNPGAGSNQSVDVSELGMDGSRFSPLGEVHLMRGNWRWTARGMLYASDQTVVSEGAGQVGDLAFGAGETIRTSLDFSSYQFEGAYQFAEWEKNPLDGGGYAVRSRLDAVFGLRMYDVEFELTSLTGAGTPEVSDEFFVEPQLGLQWTMELYEQLDVETQIMLGAMPADEVQSSSLDFMVGFTWRPTDHVGLQIGYRALFFSFSNEEAAERYEFDGSLQGLYGGIVITF